MLNVKEEVYSGEVLGRQTRVSVGKPTLYYVEVWYDDPKERNLYALFVTQAEFTEIKINSIIQFSAKKGRLTGQLHQRKLKPLVVKGE